MLPIESEVELLVVDNASTDKTREVVESHHSAFYSVRYVFEPNRGKGNAYNAGLREAIGEICIFTDDDVVPSEVWLKSHLDAYQDSAVAAVQGAIELQFDTQPPPWLSSMHRDMLAEKLPGELRIFPYNDGLVGANMSFRKSVANAAGPFSPILGPGRAGFWDESEFALRVKRLGLLTLFEPAARVKHLISASRLTVPYFADAAFRQGVSTYLAEELGAYTVTRRPVYRTLYVLARQIKVRIKSALKSEHYNMTSDYLLYRMHMGATWAWIVGFERLNRRYRV